MHGRLSSGAGRQRWLALALQGFLTPFFRGWRTKARGYRKRYLSSEERLIRKTSTFINKNRHFGQKMSMSGLSRVDEM
jgi:hypothetical protein